MFMQQIKHFLLQLADVERKNGSRPHWSSRQEHKYQDCYHETGLIVRVESVKTKTRWKLQRRASNKQKPASASVTQMFTDVNIFQTLRHCMHKCGSLHVKQCFIRRIFPPRFRWKDFLCSGSWNIFEAINSNTSCSSSGTNVCKTAVGAKSICHSLWHLLQELSHFVCLNAKDWIRWGCRSWRLERRSYLLEIAESPPRQNSRTRPFWFCAKTPPYLEIFLIEFIIN